MALIQLHKPGRGDADGPRDSYVDLTAGTSGHVVNEHDLDGLPGAAAHAVLATGLTTSSTLGLRLEEVSGDYDDITYKTAADLDGPGNFELLPISSLSLHVGARFILRLDTSPVRFFKGEVRPMKAAFSSDMAMVEFEELVEGRLIWPLTVNLSGDTLTVENEETEIRTITKDHDEMLFTLRPRRYQVDGEVVRLKEFFDNPFPIAKVEFVANKGSKNETVVRPTWIENVEIAAGFSRSYVNSTYLIRLNTAGRPNHGEADETLQFNVYLVDRAFTIEEWDPTVVVEDQE